MSARLQAGAALVLALGLHLGAFALQPDPAGAVAAGAGGSDLVSLQAADASLSDLIAEWDRPPQPEVAPLADLAPPTAPEMPPALMAAQPEPPQPSAPQPLALPPGTDTAPLADTTLPPPPPPEPEPEPEPQPDPPKIRPEPRPATLAQPKPAPAAKPAPKATPAAKANAAPQAQQRAAGAGNGAQAGNAGTAQAATLSQVQANDLKSSWGASIRSRVERRKSYPATAGRASGTVTVRLTVTRAGALAGVSVAQSSGHPALDQAALRAVQSARSFPAAPAGLQDASYSFTLPIAFAR